MSQITYVKVCVLSGEIVATAGCPAVEFVDEVERDEDGHDRLVQRARRTVLPETDHEGLLILECEGDPHDWEFDPDTWSLRRKTPDAVVAARLKALADKRRGKSPGKQS